jgi:hypothetical protein
MQDMNNSNSEKATLSDQRKHSRHDFPFLTIEYTLNSTSPSEACIGFVLNITASGLCLKTNKQLKEGQNIIIKNLLSATSKKAVVRWIQRSSTIYYKVGLEFI